ncbi:MAG: hypothetical protein KF767_12585 [Bdellovibrionaceae bacterium]|nr:hypothetical protein [Pseudobdellovibrionaceae bacterium]
MSNVIRSLKTNGYNLEEAYFHKKDRELIEQMREEAKKEEGAKVIDMAKWKNAKSPPTTTEEALPTGGKKAS